MSGQSERTNKNGLGSAEGRPQGVITALDKELIALIGIARYLSTRQAHELLRRNTQESASRRRLAALAGLSRLSKPNRVPKGQPRVWLSARGQRAGRGRTLSSLGVGLPTCLVTGGCVAQTAVVGA